MSNNWANRTKEALAEVNVEPLEEELEIVSEGMEPIVLYYRFKEPTKPQKSPYAILAVGQVISGTYAGSFLDKKFKKPTHKVRTEAGLIGVPGAGSINKALSKVAEGARVRITYNGTSPMKSGEYAGTDAHGFTVAASRRKQ